MSGPYKSIPRCHFCQNPPPQGGFFYALIHFTARKNCGILNKLLNGQQTARPRRRFIKRSSYDPYSH